VNYGRKAGISSPRTYTANGVSKVCVCVVEGGKRVFDNFTGLDSCPGLLDCLTQTAIKCLFTVGQRLNVLIQPVTLLVLFP